MKKLDTKRLTILAMLTAMAYVVMYFLRIPVSFLTYEPKDAILTITGFLFGPLDALLAIVLVALIEMFTVSDTGPIGMLMNVIAASTFVCTASVIYRKHHTLKGALVGLAALVRRFIHFIVSRIFDGPGVNGEADPEFDLLPEQQFAMGDGAQTWGGWQVLETVVIVLCTAGILVGLAWLLYRKLPALLRRLGGFFRSSWPGEDAGLTDTGEGLFSRYSDCTDDTQRLRFWYARLLEKLQQNGREAPDTMTPLELARREGGAVRTLCRTYSAVRYGQSPATADQVQQARAAVEGIKERK